MLVMLMTQLLLIVESNELPEEFTEFLLIQFLESCDFSDSYILTKTINAMALPACRTIFVVSKKTVENASRALSQRIAAVLA
jgi:hypothetical protein